jgi:hypothetical protein
MYHQRGWVLNPGSTCPIVERIPPMRRMPVLLLSAFAAAAALTTSVVTAGSAQAARTLPHTQRIVVRPVHANGTPVAGYTVTREQISGFTCRDVSNQAVDNNIDYCGFSATYTVACWKSTNHTVLCLRDPMVKKLVRIRYQGTFKPTTKVRHPSPQALRLFNGNYCTVRDGGAWPMVKHHPNWFGTYSCIHNGIYGTGRDGIDRSVNPWRVHVVTNTQRGYYTNRRVKLAYYVGTAS